ncbi:MAG: serine hydrolase [Chloroflexota bacterium]|nr:serine hydrolase [Chloroflexota bacterium]
MTGGADATEIPALLLDRYRVDGLLGEGGLGTVVMAFDTRLKRRVAIKSLRRALYTADPDQFRRLEERFTREAEAGSRMGSHPNLVTVHDFVSDADKTLYLILEYVAGGTLAQRIKQGPLPPDDALRITAEAARGLQAAHDAGLVHRDVKPANLFIAADGRVEVGDFGIAQIDDISGRTQTTTGHPGTPIYMSPEQAGTTGYVSPAADQYSLGLVLFEMLTGKAYKRLRKQEAAEMIARQPPPVAALVERMLAPDPDDRYLSMRDLGLAIAAVERTLAMEAETPYRAPISAGPPGTPSAVSDNSTHPIAVSSGVSPTPPSPPFIVPPQPVHRPAPPPSRTSRRAFLAGIGGLGVAGVAGGAIFLLRDPGGGKDALATSSPVVGAGAPTVGQTTIGAAPLPTIQPTTTITPTATRLPATETPAPTAAPPSPTPRIPTATTPAILQPTASGPNKGVQVQRALTSLPAGSSVYYTDISSNSSASVDPDRIYPAAALIDLFIITEAYHQVDQNKLKLTDTLPIRPEDIVGGTGVLQNRQGGTTTIKECVDLITAESDNTAANLLINRLGMDAINGTIKTLGLSHTALRRRLADDAARKAGIENETSAGDMAAFLAQLVRGNVYNRTVSNALVQAIAQQNKPEWDFLGGGLQPRPQIVHMTGQIPPANGAPGVLHDAGIFYPTNKGAYIFVFLNQSTATNKEIGVKAGEVSQTIFPIATA